MAEAWVSAFIGGMCIGAAALMLLLFNGRIAGISGIVGGLLPPWVSDLAWRFAFVLGLVVSAWVLSPFGPHLPDVNALTPLAAVVAGLLVGVGTRLGNGCTSGHGICGIGRLSPRSIAATLTFMLFGFATATLLYWIGK